MLSGSLTPCTATLLASSRLKSTSSTTSDEYNALLPPSSAASEKSSCFSRHGSQLSLNHQPAASLYQSSQSHNSSGNNPYDQNFNPTSAPAATAAPTVATNSHGRSAALERAYVHDVYEHCEEPAGPVRPRVAQFLSALEPGSMVCDVGCGSGRYLNANPLCFTLGVDRCARLAAQVRASGGGAAEAGTGGGEVALCDNLELPFRDECFDAVLSVAVVHHFATTERRVGALRELARVLRIGGRVIITVWALEQKQRRFESQDVLIPWQQPKSASVANFSDEDDDDEFLPPYHAYTEDSTNSSRSAGDGDSSSLSSSSPGESCYSFVRRAIQKLAGTGRRHPWFLDNWSSKDTRNGSSLDYEDAKDLPIELRRLEDFEDITSLVGGGSTKSHIVNGHHGHGGHGHHGHGSNGHAGGGPVPNSVDAMLTGLKSRSLGSILYPPSSTQLAHRIVRSRSSVPSLGGSTAPHQQHLPEQYQHQQQHVAAHQHHQHQYHHPHQHQQQLQQQQSSLTNFAHHPHQLHHSPQHRSSSPAPACGSANTVTTSSTHTMVTPCVATGTGGGSTESLTPASAATPPPSASPAASRRPRLVKQKQSLCDEESATASGDITLKAAALQPSSPDPAAADLASPSAAAAARDSRALLRKQSSLNEELMAENRIRERERVKKRIQKQTSLNESHLTRSAVFSRKFQVMRDGLTTKLKSGTGSLERVTKSGLVKIMQTVKSTSVAVRVPQTAGEMYQAQAATGGNAFGHIRTAWAGVVRQASNSPPAVMTTSTSTFGSGSTTGSLDAGDGSGGPGADGVDGKERRHSRESGSDSSKDSLQSDTSIESEDSFASVIFIPKGEVQQQKQLQTQHTQTSLSQTQLQVQQQFCIVSATDLATYTTAAAAGHFAVAAHRGAIPVPTSPLMMPCPTPAHSPAPQRNGSGNGRTPNSALFGNGAGGQTQAEQTRFPFENLPMPMNYGTGGRCDANYNQQYAGQFGAVYGPPHSRQPGAQHRFGQYAAAAAGGNSLTPPLTNAYPQQPSASSGSSPLLTAKPASNSAVVLSSQHSASCSSPSASSTAASASHQHHQHHHHHHHHHHQQQHSKTPSPKAERITRQTVKNLPQIPKFRRHASISYPIVRRANCAVPAVPKLSSLELFNPATDDLDSDSSEPSSPDSVDSVISAFKPAVTSATTTATSANTSTAGDGSSEEPSSGKATASITPEPAALSAGTMVVPASSASPIGQSGVTARGLDKVESSVETATSSATTPETVPVVSTSAEVPLPATTASATDRQELLAFAEKLSAQLLKEMDSGRLRGVFDEQEEDEAEAEEAAAAASTKHRACEGHTRSGQSSTGGSGGAKHEDPYIRRLNGELKDLHSLREELRERRLMLANLNISQYQNSSTIEEEDESPTALAKSADELQHQQQQQLQQSQDDGRRSVTSADRLPRLSSIDAASSQDDIASRINSVDNLSVLTAEAAAMETGRDSPRQHQPAASQISSQQRAQASHQAQAPAPGPAPPMESRPSVDSWAHSNSTASLDSPSAGGSSTHHRYYHVFREGELEALINHHVTSLHIVSSYYERASWCVVAEKVQVWSI